ncbi:MAG: nucleotidyltransferase family protein [Pseudoxanthomonas sp.]|jgi:molybdenum cofactor cytidylyltransferase|uniref:nucleotidyltransferase family protein n=1 Tax=Pseudoxanthomonas TaxID=83618 RepID=UPI00138A5EAF|nr:MULTISPECIES: nucleotidyltransferase family protein [Pseudoxanthomonas]KAF1720970.1 CTP--molybdopterin cytidylyltransferase [Pseudoxanthomonas mexicana]MCH2091836.1 nucleotidyltransferase family protein [Pseudoxanthomonas sp.]
MTVPHVAVVLAAGGSTRLGRPKQLLTRDGETLVHRAARLALASGAARVRVIVGAHADDVVAAVRDLPVECLVNPRWNEGLAGSVRVALDALAAHDRATLLLTCDQPALDLVHVQVLLAAARAAPSGSAATRFGDRVGVPAVVAPTMLPAARDLQGDRGLCDVLNAAGAGVIACDAPDLGIDIDTPEDVAEAVSRGWLDAPT